MRASAKLSNAPCCITQASSCSCLIQAISSACGLEFAAFSAAFSAGFSAAFSAAFTVGFSVGLSADGSGPFSAAVTTALSVLTSGGLGAATGATTGATTASPLSVLTASAGFKGVGVLLEDMPTVDGGGVGATTGKVDKGGDLLGPAK